MKIINRIVVIILTTFSSGYMFSEEHSVKFSNIPWETSPEQVIFSNGLPDSIDYFYDYDENIGGTQTTMEMVWINSMHHDSEMLERAKKNNIPIGVNIGNIIDGNKEVGFTYNNIPYFKFNSTVFLKFEDKKLYRILYIIDTKNLSITEKNDMLNFLKNYFLQFYGSSDYLTLTKNNSITNFMWYLTDTIVDLDIFLPENEPRYSKFSYIDRVHMGYSYKNY